jgi:HPt (histidine-containing phosphotransfer) domain-containing protein
MSRDEAEIALAAMRERYRAKLGSELAQLAALLAESERGGSVRERLEAVHALAHRLMGTSGSYGLPACSEALGRIEARAAGLLSAPDGAAGAPWREMASDLAAARNAAGV